MPAGRPPKPLEKHHREGTFNVTKHGGFLNPEAPSGTPKPTRELAPEEREVWDRLVADLTTSKAIATVDGGVMTDFCRLSVETEQTAELRDVAAASLRTLEANLGDVGGMEPDDKIELFREIGRLNRALLSYIGNLRQARLAKLRMWQEFGLTPASRGRVRLPKPDIEESQDPLAALTAQAKQIRAVK